jgi:S-(hydroxymethyl)glutathione dehydrogenase/alcohol dehydrogenase
VGGTVYGWNGTKVNAGGITTFSRHAVISENRLTPIPAGISAKVAALIGCAIPTGVGVVVNTAQPRPGQSLAVFGTGGIGMCVIAGAVVSGCAPIIAVDVLAEKLAQAKSVGASHVFNPAEGDPVEAIRKTCPGGVDFAIEATGKPAVMRQALASVRSQGGTAVVIGNARRGECMELDPWELNLGKRLLGTWGGDNWPDRDFPRYGRLLQCGKLNVAPLLSRSYRLNEINLALDDMKRGAVVRPLIDMSLE